MHQSHKVGSFNGAIIVYENNLPVYSNAFGYADFDEKIKFKTSTSMDAASMTKTFTALSFLLLEKEEKLSFEDSVEDHLLGFPYPEIRIEHLLYQKSELISDDFVFNQAMEGEVLDNAFF